MYSFLLGFNAESSPSRPIAIPYRFMVQTTTVALLHQ